MNITYLMTALAAMISLGACAVEHPPQDWKRIDVDRAGHLTHNLPFDRDTLQSKFPGAILIKTKVDTYGDPLDGIEVSLPGQVDPLFYVTFVFNWEVTPPKQESIFSVYTRHPEIAGPGGARIGTTTVAELNQAIELDCSFGQNDLQDTYVCLVGDFFRALFTAPKGYDGAYRRAPADIRDAGVLSEMMYYPQHVR